MFYKVFSFHMDKRESKPVPIRIEPELDAKIEEAARLTGMSKADVMRLAMRIGFEDLRRINYDIAGAVLDAAKPVPSPLSAKRPPAA
jgi:predicted DNA-binding protein